jgi:hypothetical protein
LTGIPLTTVKVTYGGFALTVTLKHLLGKLKMRAEVVLRGWLVIVLGSLFSLLSILVMHWFCKPANSVRLREGAPRIKSPLVRCKEVHGAATVSTWGLK